MAAHRIGGCLKAKQKHLKKGKEYEMANYVSTVKITK